MAMNQKLLRKINEIEGVTMFGLALLYPFRRIVEPPKRLIGPYVKKWNRVSVWLLSQTEGRVELPLNTCSILGSYRS